MFSIHLQSNTKIFVCSVPIWLALNYPKDFVTPELGNFTVQLTISDSL